MIKYYFFYNFIFFNDLTIIFNNLVIIPNDLIIIYNNLIIFFNNIEIDDTITADIDNIQEGNTTLDKSTDTSDLDE